MNLTKRVLWRVMNAQRPIVPASLKRFVTHYSPVSVFCDEPIGQIVISDDDVSTYLCINNFYTFLAPGLAGAAEAVVRVFDTSGRCLLTEKFTLERYGSLGLSVDELLRRHSVECPLGLATCVVRFLPASGAEAAQLKQLGRITSQFFAYYLGRRREAMALIHPQTVVNQSGNVEMDAVGWRSCQGIRTFGLQSVRVYQANHSVQPSEVRYSLHRSADDTEVASATARVAPCSAAMADFDTLCWASTDDEMYLRVNRLPTPNGKPLLMRRFANHLFSMSHG
jgi:hypothetical protein